MSTSYWDAVAFIPKKDIWFCGFGLFANYNCKDIVFKIQWHLGKEGEEYASEEYEVELKDSDKDTEKKWWLIDIRDVGEKPLKVRDGTYLHIKVKVDSDDNRRCHYGYNGYKDYYSKFDF